MQIFYLKLSLTSNEPGESSVIKKETVKRYKRYIYSNSELFSEFLSQEYC